MHSITHSLAHRAPPASRTRARWQPYNALSSSSSSSSITSSAKPSPLSVINTPATSLPSPNPHSQPSLNCEPDSSRLPPSTTSTSTPSCKDTPANKCKFALGLVDQAVKTLGDIWRPQDIPAAFNNPKHSTSLFPADTLSLSTPSSRSLSSSALCSPISTPSRTLPPVPTTQVLLQSGTSEVRNPLVPIRGFVHEVLRRSRTSGCVLQTALCYLEAIRPKIPELLQDELEGNGVKGEPEPTSSVTVATEDDLRIEAELTATQMETDLGTIRCDDDIMDTVRFIDENSFTTAVNSSQNIVDDLPPVIPPPAPHPKPPTTPLTPLPPLPSPLLCPRRAFLAALILASKFTQDKCYSNRAWAKLSGLPPREIGRCERALGNALDWRLWVGKSKCSAATQATTALPTQRSLVRCQSEPSLMSPLAASQPALVRPEVSLATVPESPQVRDARKLKRSSTLPAEQFPGPQFALITSRKPVDFERQVYAHQPRSTNPAVSDGGYSDGSSSPGSDVPSLSYSPTSTISSSSSEGTGQMSAFLGDMTPSTCGDSTAWTWLEYSDGNSGAYVGASGITDSLSPVAHINAKLLHGNGLSGFSNGFAPAPAPPLTKHPISIRYPVDPPPPPLFAQGVPTRQGQHRQWDPAPTVNPPQFVLTSTA